MKLTTLFLLFALTGLMLPARAATVPTSRPGPSLDYSTASLSPKQIEKLTGKKLTPGQKIKLKLLQWKLGKTQDEEAMTTRQKRQAGWSLGLGLASLLLLFLPYVALLAIPAAILAIIFGSKSLRGNSNAKGIIGIIAGGLSIVLLIAAIIVWAVFLAAFI